MRVIVLGSIVTLDVETVQPDHDGEDFAPLPLHKPVAICWLERHPSGTAVPMRRSGPPDGEWEEVALQDLASSLKRAKRLVSWNGRRFDMPLLTLRAMRLGIDWSFWDGMRHRYPHYKNELVHYDLVDQLGDYGAGRGLSLDRVAKLMGLPGKGEVDGSKVDTLAERGAWKEIEDYCIDDVRQTYVLYLHTMRTLYGADTREALEQIGGVV